MPNTTINIVIFYLNLSIQMYLSEDPRKKNTTAIPLKTLKNNNSHNPLINNLDHKRSDLSKEKLRVTSQMPETEIDPKGSAVICYRPIKNGQSQPKKDFAQLKITRKTSTHEQNPMQVNLNIQNMITRKPQDAPADRSHSQKRKEDQKSRREKTTPFDEFECCEELEYKLQRKTEKKIQPLIRDKSPRVEKTALLKAKDIGVSDLKREIKDFEMKVEQVLTLQEGETLCYLDERQLAYQVDPLYIEKNQKNLTWTMRAILVEWMMHISYEFRLKRETLHIALTLVDNFFQVTSNLAKADFQLSGAAALFIAAKLQQFEPLSSREFSKSTKDRYTAEEIRGMECRIVRTLKYNLNPPTLNMWANKLMQQWDLFVDSAVSNYFAGQNPPYFKRIDQESYKNYRQVMQILDCAMLDIQTVQYRPKILACSVLYLILGKQCGEFKKKRIVEEFPRTSIFFIDEGWYNSVFRAFLEQCLGLNMFDLLPSVQYLSTYFILPLTFERPCLKMQDENVEEMHLQEYCSYQTYNPNMLSTVRKRFRGIYQYE